MEKTIKQIYPLITKGAKISIDSRNIDNDTIFVALKGAQHDGNDFAQQAIDNGALMVIADKPELNPGQKIIKVNNSLETLQELARYHRKLITLPVIGITGSNGKTTTKELISSVLKEKYNTLFTQGNFNNHIGLPITILNIKPEHEIAVIEMGANHVGEIDFLCNIAMPTAGLITNIGKAHIEGFGSLENVVVAKTELYRYLEQNKGLVFINTDNGVLTQNCHAANKITYSQSEQSDYSGKISASHPFICVDFFPAKNISAKINICSNLVGSYNFENILAAASIGHYFQVEVSLIKKAIEHYAPSNNRSQFKDSGKNKIIMDAYNANPSSMEAAIKNFSEINEKPKAMILGDMLELGHISEAEHKRILKLALDTDPDLIILVGKEFEKLSLKEKHVHKFSDHSSASLWLQKKILKGYTILIKGSRGIQLEKLEPWL
jgi:UDP-N-acetylmuramoyl-tripeptide--D-alanyl-D-alanine ligase